MKEPAKEKGKDRAGKVQQREDRQKWADEAFDKWMSGGQKGRLSFTWNAIIDWDIEEVWQACGTSQEDVDRRISLYKSGNFEGAIAGFPAHWAYCSGNSRLSCGLCVLASKSDLINGAIHNPLVWLELVELEMRSGWWFRKDLSLMQFQKFVAMVEDGFYRRLSSTLNRLNLLKPEPPQMAIALLAVRLWCFVLLQTFVA